MSDQLLDGVLVSVPLRKLRISDFVAVGVDMQCGNGFGKATDVSSLSRSMLCLLLHHPGVTSPGLDPEGSTV